MPTAQGDISTAEVGGNRAVLQGLHTAQAATAQAKAAGPRNTRLDTQQNGNASTTVFNIAHNLPAAPTTFWVTPRNAVSSALHAVTADATNVIITFAAAPASGTNNVTFTGYAAI